MGLFDKLKKAFGVQEEKPQSEQSEAIKENQADEQVAIKQPELEENQDKTTVLKNEETSNQADVTVDEVSEAATEKTVDTVENKATEEVTSVNEQNQAQNVAETQRYYHGLTKSRDGFGAKINALLANFRSVDEDFFDDLEETLIEADVGFEMAMKISEELRNEVKFQNVKQKKDVSNVIIEKLVNIYEEEGKSEDSQLHFAKQGPTIYLFVGVNGVGKTTTIGKLAHRYQTEGKKVLMAAADTFRAGAIEQLVEWGRRVNVEVVHKEEKSDPAAVVFEAVQKAKKENYDILLVDTAGRLQNKVNLMNELEKIQRVIVRELPEAPHEVILALDATTGQNALTQAKQFGEVTKVSGIVLTKLDGTARGGIVLAIRNELHIPVKLVGLGEKMDDLRDFNSEEFVYGLFKGLVTQD